MLNLFVLEYGKTCFQVYSTPEYISVGPTLLLLFHLFGLSAGNVRIFFVTSYKIDPFSSCKYHSLIHSFLFQRMPKSSKLDRQGVGVRTFTDGLASPSQHVVLCINTNVEQRVSRNLLVVHITFLIYFRFKFLFL